MSPKDAALALFVAALWGFNFIVMKHAASEVPPLFLTLLRFALAAVPAILIVPRPAVPWPTLIAFGIAFGVVQFSLLFSAFALGMPAGLAALVLQTQVLMTVVLAAALIGERPGRRQWTGLVLAASGLAVIMAERATGGSLLPVLLVAAAALSWAVANIIAKQAAPGDVLGFAVWTSVVPPLPVLALSLAIEGPAAIRSSLAGLSWLGVGAILYLAYPISLLSIAIWSGLLRRQPAARLAPFILLVPVIGFVAGHIVYGETIGWATAAGGVLILAAIGLTLRPGTARPG